MRSVVAASATSGKTRLRCEDGSRRDDTNVALRDLAHFHLPR